MAANEILASLDDVNGFLPDMIEMVDGVSLQYQIDAQRLIRSQLAGVFTPLVLTGWDSPDDTPELIRGIAGRLIAAKYYSIQYSQESTNIPAYSQGLYNEAIALLRDIRSGAIIVTDDNNDPIPTNGSEGLSSGDVFPNNAQPEPIFGIGMEFG